MNKALNIWLHDYHFTHGTAVGHDDENHKKIRKKKTWFLTYSLKASENFEKTTIHCSKLIIQIEFFNHRAKNPPYIENLRAFMKKCQKATQRSRTNSLSIKALDLINEPSTQASSEVSTPRERLIYYSVKYVGKKTFDKIMKIIKAQNEKVFVVKTFDPPQSLNKRGQDKPNPKWLRKIQREFSLMKNNPHVSFAVLFNNSLTT